MKKVFFVFSIGLFFTVLSACGTEESTDTSEPTSDTETEVTEEDTTESNNQANDTATGEPTPIEEETTDEISNSIFQEFQLDVEVRDNDIIDVDYEVEGSQVEAEYKDQHQDINMTGTEAQDALEMIFAQFSFDEDTPDEEVIDEVLQHFNVEGDPNEVEIEVQFTNGTEKEYKR